MKITPPKKSFAENVKANVSKDVYPDAWILKY